MEFSQKQYSGYVSEETDRCFCFLFLLLFLCWIPFNILFSLLVHAHSILYPCWATSLTLAEWEKREQQTGTNMIMVKEA